MFSEERAWVLRPGMWNQLISFGFVTKKWLILGDESQGRKIELSALGMRTSCKLRHSQEPSSVPAVAAAGGGPPYLGVQKLSWSRVGSWFNLSYVNTIPSQTHVLFHIHICLRAHICKYMCADALAQLMSLYRVIHILTSTHGEHPPYLLAPLGRGPAVKPWDLAASWSPWQLLLPVARNKN